MNVILSQSAEKAFRRLPSTIQKKVKKQFLLLDRDFFYPSLHTKRMTGIAEEWEIRIDRQYRASFRKTGDTVVVDSLGPHDASLGKK